jgi:hypothetical protein
MSMIINPFAFGGTSPSGDPFWAQVVALMHFEGPDGSTTITDQTGRTWTAAGNAQIDTAQAKFGSSSLLMDGASDWLSTSPGAGLTFGTNDFTIEGWIRRTAAFAVEDIWSQRGAANGITLRLNATGKVEFFYGAGTGLIATTTSIHSDGTWDFVTLSRVGTSAYLFLNGALEATGVLPGALNFGMTNPSYLGRRSDSPGNFFNGHMDEFRFTNGVGRYTSSFTPPAAAFPDGP